MAESQAQKASNLARIRDNQRRSRARRKEYLQELETKYRECEIAGVTASAEIQTAARRVVDENKRLRKLLKQRGLSDVEIDATLMDDSQDAPPSSTLEGLLDAHRTCSPRDSRSSLSVSQTDSPMPTPSPHATYLQPSPQPTWPPELYVNAHRTAQFGVDYTQYPGPMATSPDLHQTIPAQQPYDPTHQQYGTSPYLTSGYVTPLDPQLGWLQNYPTADFLKGVPQPNLVPSSRNGPSGSSSCEDAAYSIRVFKPDMGRELEEELGCGIAGVQCQVPNQEVFRIVDKYTSDNVR